jgi:hypothetical protein
MAFLVQLDHLRLADHSHERSDPSRQLRSDVACWSTAATRAIRIRRRMSTTKSFFGARVYQS